MNNLKWYKFLINEGERKLNVNLTLDVYKPQFELMWSKSEFFRKKVITDLMKHVFVPALRTLNPGELKQIKSLVLQEDFTAKGEIIQAANTIEYKASQTLPREIYDVLRYIDFQAYYYFLRLFFFKEDKSVIDKLNRVRTSIAAASWKFKYGDDLKHIITFVGAGKSGSVYLADNWKKIGETSGLPSHKSSSMKWNTKQELKELFVKPTGENKKIIFIKTLK